MGETERPEAIRVDHLELKDLPVGAQLVIFLKDGNGFHVMLTQPTEAQGVVRPAILGQQGAGYRDVKSTMGSRPWHEGAQPQTASREEDEGVEWGVLKFDDELVMRNDDYESGGLIFTGQPIAEVYAAEAVNEGEE